MFLHDQLIFPEFLIVLFFAAVLIALAIALKDSLEARHITKGEHEQSER